MHPTPDSLALLALGEDLENPAELAHVSICPVCTAQVEELAKVVELGRAADEDEMLQTPDPVVWQRIRAELFAPTPAASPVRTARGVRRSIFALVAALALIAGLGLGFGLGRVGEPTPPAAAATVHLNGLPSWPGSEGEAKLTTNAQGQQELVVSVSTPEPVQGTFEVWLSDDRALHMRTMGTLNGDAGTFVIPPDMDLDASPVIDVSLEPLNDPEPDHSKNSVVRGRLRL